MRNLEIQLSHVEDSKWHIEVYNPNIGCVVYEVDQTFDTTPEAACWLDIFGTVEKQYERCVIGHINANDMKYAEELLGFRYQDVI